MLVIPYFIAHRGCPHRCLFCNQLAIAGPMSAQGDPGASLTSTIERWLGYGRGGGTVQLAFFGGSFTCLEEGLQQRLLEAAQPYIRAGSIHSIRVSTRPDCLNPGLCEFLRSYGVRTVELGAQSMNDRVLERACRGHSSADVRAAAALLREQGFELGLQLMLGLPGETTTTFLSGAAALIDLRPDFVRLYPTLVIRGTGLADMVERQDWRPLSLNQAVTLARLARERFMAQGIRVIRMGLQPSADLETQLISGPYHPAFGELVLSRTWYRRTRHLLSRAGVGKTVTMTISARDYSAFAGPRKLNLTRLARNPSAAALVVKTDGALARDQYRYAIS